MTCLCLIKIPALRHKACCRFFANSFRRAYLENCIQYLPPISILILSNDNGQFLHFSSAYFKIRLHTSAGISVSLVPVSAKFYDYTTVKSINAFTIFLTVLLYELLILIKATLSVLIAAYIHCIYLVPNHKSKENLDRL